MEIVMYTYQSKKTIFTSLSMIAYLTHASTLLANKDDILNEFIIIEDDQGEPKHSSSPLMAPQKAENVTEPNLNEEQFFSHQNKNFTRNEMDSLIKRGQQIIQALLNKEPPENMYDKRNIKIFEGNLSKFFDSYYNHAPGIEQAKKVTKAVLRWIPVMSSYVPEDRLPQNTFKRQQLLEDVIAVSWAIAYASCVKKEGFIRGSFSIKDDDQLLSNFFKSYAMEASEVNSGKLEHLNYPTNFNGSYFAYNRTGDYYSSHYRGQSIYQIGIDARFESTGYALKVLPFNYTHILFGRVRTTKGKEKTFFKLEEDGLGDVYSTFKHWENYLKSIGQPVENPHSMRREKDIFPSTQYSHEDQEYRTGNEMILDLKEIGLKSS